MPAHRDDPFRAELLGGQHGEQTDRAVADHRDGLAGADLGRDGTEPSRAEHVGGRQETRDQVVGGNVRRRDQGAVGQRYAQVLGLGAEPADRLTVHA